MSELDIFQRAVGEWADKNFPHSSPKTITAHLSDEVGELIADPSDPSEAADAVLLLLHLAHKQGYSLLEVARAKHDRNLRRKWGSPDSRGVVRHTEEPPCA